MKNFKNLKVWQKSHKLTLKIYKITTKFPKEELYGLSNQMRRSSSSIPTNIAEGCGRSTDADFRRFLQMAMGSASELEYQLLLTFDLKYFNSSVYDELNNNIIEIKRMLSSLIKKLKADC
ncbi:MAG: four helix bundle protein [Spirochaetales bacterium]|nr:four helix bundle protein [Spirochaetales bacterium]